MDPTGGAVNEQGLPIPSRLLLEEVDGCLKNKGSGYGRLKFFDGESSEISSSVQTPDDSDNDLSVARDGDSGEEEEVQSKLSGVAGLSFFGSFRRLSSHQEGIVKPFHWKIKIFHRFIPSDHSE